MLAKEALPIESWTSPDIGLVIEAGEAPKRPAETLDCAAKASRSTETAWSLILYGVVRPRRGHVWSDSSAFNDTCTTPQRGTPRFMRH